MKSRTFLWIKDWTFCTYTVPIACECFFFWIFCFNELMDFYSFFVLVGFESIKMDFWGKREMFFVFLTTEMEKERKTNGFETKRKKKKKEKKSVWALVESCNKFESEKRRLFRFVVCLWLEFWTLNEFLAKNLQSIRRPAHALHRIKCEVYWVV